VRALVIAALLTGAIAAADSARDEAKRLRDLGAEALDRGELAAALERFEQAYRAFPSPKLLYNLGLALGELGRYPEAIDAFERFLAQASDAPQATREWAQRRIGELEPRCARLSMVARDPEVNISLDGRALDVHQRTSIRVLPGAHEISASRAGFAPSVTHVELSAGENRELTVELAPLPAPTATSANAPPALQTAKARPARTPLVKRWWLWTVVGGVVAGGAIAAGVLGAQSAHRGLPNSSLGAVYPAF
jgi:tetratricopeptide (TPR) repeat protein